MDTMLCFLEFGPACPSGRWEETSKAQSMRRPSPNAKLPRCLCNVRLRASLSRCSQSSGECTARSGCSVSCIHRRSSHLAATVGAQASRDYEAICVALMTAASLSGATSELPDEEICDNIKHPILFSLQPCSAPVASSRHDPGTNPRQTS